jgi:site-specific DNA-methyltransferase (adenine-specific)
MGMKWDGGDIAHNPVLWAEVLRVLKPGGYLLAFGGTRTYHRLACAIEDAGFEIRDQIGWAFGSGFPKSHNGPWGGTALKPAWEPIVMARKPLIGTVAANVQQFGTGGLNIDGCRVPVSDVDVRDVGREINRNVRQEDGWGMNGEAAKSGVCVVKP